MFDDQSSDNTNPSSGDQTGVPISPVVTPPPITPLATTVTPVTAQPATPPPVDGMVPHTKELGMAAEPQAPGEGFAAWQQTAGVAPATSAPLVNGEDQLSDLFKRETLGIGQKVAIVIATIAVLGVLIGGGIWLYYELDPFGEIVPEIKNDSLNSLDQLRGEDGINTNETKETTEEGIRESTNENINQSDTVVNEIPLQKRDTDGDGLLDIDETKRRTDPELADTDGDGYNDKSEIDNGYDPLDPEA